MPLCVVAYLEAGTGINRFLFKSRTVCLYEIHQCSGLGHLMDSLSLKPPFYKLYSAYCLTLRLACNIVKTGGEITFLTWQKGHFSKMIGKSILHFSAKRFVVYFCIIIFGSAI